MASNHVFDALILYTSDITITAPEDQQVSRPHGKWALLLDSLLNPVPGRTLDLVYTSLGKVLEKRANCAAHALGFGSHVVAQKIKSHFGKSEERVQHLELLRNSIPGKLEKHCWRLMKYTLPTESAKTQCRAFKNIVDVITLFPGLRVHFLRAKFLKSTTSTDTISALWDRPSGPPDEEWKFWQSLAATCLSDTAISAILKEISVPQLTSCDGGSLSVIERLLVEHDCA
ncbi:hypothetical protein B0H13DRAFT_385494 [Mycena leptocephala]|nr:hypothetical protein B0H13DRAFT_385494 [Mycena leptocephala]